MRTRHLVNVEVARRAGRRCPATRVRADNPWAKPRPRRGATTPRVAICTTRLRLIFAAGLSFFICPTALATRANSSGGFQSRLVDKLSLVTTLDDIPVSIGLPCDDGKIGSRLSGTLPSKMAGYVHARRRLVNAGLMAGLPFPWPESPNMQQPYGSGTQGFGPVSIGALVLLVVLAATAIWVARHPQLVPKI